MLYRLLAIALFYFLGLVLGPDIQSLSFIGAYLSLFSLCLAGLLKAHPILDLLKVLMVFLIGSPYFVPMLLVELLMAEDLKCPTSYLPLLSLFLLKDATSLFLSALALLLSALLYQFKRTVQNLAALRSSQEAQGFAYMDKIRDLRTNTDLKAQQAKLEERERIAREVHDHSGHAFSSALLQVGALKVLSKEQALKEGLQNLHATLDLGMSSLRQSMHDLYNQSFDLDHEIQKLAAQMEGFQVKLNLEIDETVSEPLKRDMLAVVKEAFTNILKHSNGSKVYCQLHAYAHVYVLKIHDDGRTNLDLEQWRKRGLGLQNLESYAKRHDGRLDLIEEKGLLLRISFKKGAFHAH